MSVAARLAALRADLPAGVTLVAVSKTQPAAAIREAYEAGQRDFGENYAQEWREKADALADLPELRWHFIGALQTNKVKYLAGRVAYVHTVDREELARELSRRFAQKGAVARVFVEVNTGGEASKAGCAPGEVPALAAAIRDLPSLELVGVMGIPPPEDDPRPHFRALRALRDALGVRELSMGMSGDWRVAVEEGATFVRIGSAIFGARAPRAG
ncbi:YggS family pyridoxal phosphate-dependent enzyme [Anaeromyxobacter sp. Fw109-5]|uniref:YggS family pyridoxal phosphate-dependent enzyme n=1 Tax=Anaeromyxobacter sp. (strain Fw109-5) TaxID=404589 RepID=UPI0000ED7D82|nr:YggS family pyridoxal phosphate-dependent enzyme [Anaeromyxobacter sp. Fw109-5]ABS25572.1 alanine racemase domain protein [Anaeromyxobacter sp. Fw109-5]